MIRTKYCIINIIVLLFINYNAYGEFASIKSNISNVRVGPSLQHPIIWTFVKSNEPVQILHKSGQWIKIRDVNKEEGWIHTNLLSKKRFVVINKDTYMHKYFHKKSTKYAKILKDVRCKLNRCIPNWCYVNCQGEKGWVLRSEIWGTNNAEMNDYKTIDQIYKTIFYFLWD